MRRFARIVVALIATAGYIRADDEIGFVEEFALAKDRAASLRQLIPGTEEYYYYQCLYHQNEERYEKVDELLTAWVKRFKDSTRIREIRNRQALLTYDSRPSDTLEYLRRKLGLRFDHQREIRDKSTELSTRLDPGLIDRQVLKTRALSLYENLKGFENRALDWLVTSDLNDLRLRHLLERLERPDHPGLARLVVRDLQHRSSRGFGSLDIHSRLLLSQLDECLVLAPDLLDNRKFVDTYLGKLRPCDDENWTQSPRVKLEYLERLESFVDRLGPNFNSLKLNVLFHRLSLDLSAGRYDKPRFMAYLTLPRKVTYINSDYMKQEINRRYAADLSADFYSVTALPAISHDEPLVRSYLEHFFKVDDSYRLYQPYIDDIYLKELFAETKILAGLGDPERLAAMLPPEKFQRIKERVDLLFDPQNRTLFAGGDPVSLTLHVKNVSSLIVRIFEINTFNYYCQHGEEVESNIELDGLVPGVEQVYVYDESPLRRVTRRFEIPSLNKPGVYVVDFIGNGRNSRALIRKGELDFLVRTGTAGHIFSILEEGGALVKDASIQLAGREYLPDEGGHILVPFTNKPGLQSFVISRGGFSVLKSFEHQSEEYRFTAGIHIDRESLIAGETAEVVVRPALTLHGTPVTLSVLDDVRLVLSSKDHDGVVSSSKVHDFELFEDRESIHTFQVPPRLSNLTVSIEAKVPLLSRDHEQELSADRTFTLNRIDGTDKIEDLFLLCSSDGYVVDYLGKNGEPRPDRPISLSLKHRDFTETVDVTLQTDSAGRISLGRLHEIERIGAVDAAGTAHVWYLAGDKHTLYKSRHGLAGERLDIPFMGDGEEPMRSGLSLLELRGTSFVADRFDALSVSNGFVSVNGLPAGDYDLFLKRSGDRIRIRLTAGRRCENYIVGGSRRLEERGSHPLQIAAVDIGDESIRVHLENYSRFSRVHLFADRYHPEHAPFSSLGQGDAEPYRIATRKAESRYLEGRDIGDEYRYIIDRKYEKKYPGNMLVRPSLLLNPWAVRTTETGLEDAQAGDVIGVGGGAGGRFGGRHMKRAQAGGSSSGFSNFDFLANAAAVLLNLEPDEKGDVVVSKKLLGGSHQDVHIVAVDPLSTAYRRVRLPLSDAPLRELRLAAGLDVKKHFTQRKKVSVLRENERLVLEDFHTSSIEVYDSLSKVFEYYATLTRDPKLIEFGFVLDWPELTDEAKKEKYSKYACHELNFFLFKKDPEFFGRVVRPYLRNKKDATFLDDWFVSDDLSRYLRPWSYSRLNVVERVLLSQRIHGEKRAAGREISDLNDLIVPDVEKRNMLFQAALQSSALDKGDRFGMEAAWKEAAAVERGKFQEFLKKQDKSPDARAELEAEIELEEREGVIVADKISREAPSASKARRAAAKVAEKKLKEPVESYKSAGDTPPPADLYFDRDKKTYAAAKRFYRTADPTMEWAENNYYKLPIEEQKADLIGTNAMWKDYALHDPSEPFFSSHFIESHHNFSEMMFALSVLDLPFRPGDHEVKYEDRTMTLTAACPMLVVREEIVPVPLVNGEGSVIVSRKYYPHNDRYRYVGNEKIDNFITDEFLVNTVYGTRLVITNLSSSKKKLDALLQIPKGSIAVLGGRATRSEHLDIEPYRTRAIDYHFYFPGTGDFPHYPVHVASKGQVIAHAKPFTFEVVDELKHVDPESWPHLSQWGSAEEVLEYLDRSNLYRTDLGRIAFRMKDPAFFRKTVELLTGRHVYDHVLWSYGIFHNEVTEVREFLQHEDGFVAECGAFLDSPLLFICPVARRSYQHLDYKPLINARAHSLGRRRRILNDRLYSQYHRMLSVLSCRASLSDADRMSVVYYLLLQDRIEEALDFFSAVDADNLDTRLQYDYFAAYLDFYTPGQDLARRLSDEYSRYPVERWRIGFKAISDQLDEIGGAAPGLIDEKDRGQLQTQLAHTAPTFDFSVEARTISIDYRNIEHLRINYYLMDLELLFSRKPFMQQHSGQFSLIRPNATERVDLPVGSQHKEVLLPEEFHNANVLVEITAAGKTSSRAYYSNALDVSLMENYGQLCVMHQESGRPLSTVYVKVYTRMANGGVKFYKDGYTDLRGRFDYASLSTAGLDEVARFSILIFSEKHGALVREAAPPKQ